MRAHEILQELYGGSPLVQVSLEIPRPPPRRGSNRQMHLDQGAQKICNALMRPAGLSAALRFPEDRKGYRDWDAVSEKCKSRWRVVQRRQLLAYESQSSHASGSSTTCSIGSSCSGSSNSSVSYPQDTPPQGGPGQKTAPVPACSTRPRPRTAIGSRRTSQDVREIPAHNQTLHPDQCQQLRQQRQVPRPQSAPAKGRRPVKPLQAGGFPTEHAAQMKGGGPCGYPANEWLDGLRPVAGGQPWRR